MCHHCAYLFVHDIYEGDFHIYRWCKNFLFLWVQKFTCKVKKNERKKGTYIPTHTEAKTTQILKSYKDTYRQTWSSEPSSEDGHRLISQGVRVLKDQIIRYQHMWYRGWYQFFWRWTRLHDRPIFGFVMLESSADSMHRATSPFL